MSATTTSRPLPERPPPAAALARIDALISSFPTGTPPRAGVIPAGEGGAVNARPLPLPPAPLAATAPSSTPASSTSSATSEPRVLDTATLLARACGCPLTEDILAQLKAFMCAHSHADVDAALDAALDAYASRSAAAAPATAVATGSTSVASRAFGLLSLMGVSGGGPEPPASPRSLISAPIVVTHAAGPDSSAIPTLPAEYPDVRLSTSMLVYGPHNAVAAGEDATRAAAPAASAAPSGASSRALSLSGTAADSTGPRRRGPIMSSSSAPRRASASAVTSMRLAPTPVHVELVQTFEVTNRSKTKAHVTVRPLQAFPDGRTCFIRVDPPSLLLKKAESALVSVYVQLLRPGAHVDAFVAVETVGGLRTLVLIRALAEVSVFGLAPEDAECVESAGVAGIPKPLALLRDRIVDGEGGAGLLNEGLFRIQPSGEEVQSVREQLNQCTFAGAAAPCSAIAAAHMIKVYLRELPRRLLSAVPTEALLSASSDEQCEALVVTYLTPAYAAILRWFVDLLARVAVHERDNRMGVKALAVCVGPNLFDTDEAVNPMQALMTSQKAVHVVQKLTTQRLADMQAHDDDD